MPGLVIRLFDHDVDVEEWQHKHPGGNKLLKIFENRDATQQFVAIHKGKTAMKMFNSMPKVKSTAPTKLTAAEKEFAELIQKLEPVLNKVNPVYEVLKMSYILVFFFGGYYMILGGLINKYLGLTMMCLAMYQSGWVAHDYSHRSILPSPKWNNRVAEFLGFVQGYSDVWWKMRHNTHHMTTNEVGNDPDIKTEPVLHFFDKLTPVLKQQYQELYAKEVNDNGVSTSDAKRKLKHRKVSTAHVPSQHVYFILILSLLDVFWRYESLLILLKNRRRYKWNLAWLGCSYLFMGALVLFSPVNMLDMMVLSLVRGFMTATVVFANHYPEDRFAPDHRVGLFEQTLRTSRNTTGLFFHHGGDGFMRRLFNEGTGYLSMQIEHHLVPTWPSGHLMKLRPFVIEIAKKHNLPYVESSILQASMDNISKLSDVSLECLKHIG
jgi:fatty acid desaturase